jgi:ElaB/YqjD/DUF883 family membrane-anchored ribosome-binding protein
MFRFMNAISSPIQSLLDLFAQDLADVRFADVDAKVLTRVAADVESAAAAVAAAQSVLDEARAALQHQQDVLLQLAQRALAYARVYAENDPALSASLEAIALPRVARQHRAGTRMDGSEALVLSPEPQPPPRKRGRARKENAEGEALDTRDGRYADEARGERTLGDMSELREPREMREMNEVTSAAE